MQRSVEIAKAEVPSSAVLDAQIADGSETQVLQNTVRLPTWWQDHCQHHRQTVMVPTASTDVVQSTEPPRKRKRRLRCAGSDEHIPLAADQSAFLPKSKGTKKSLLEKFPDLQLVIKEWNKWHESAIAKDEAVTNADLRHTFDHILKHRRSEYEQAGIRNALPHKVSTWWFCKMKAAVGVKTFRYGQ